MNKKLGLLSEIFSEFFICYKTIICSCYFDCIFNINAPEETKKSKSSYTIFIGLVRGVSGVSVDTPRIFEISTAEP